MDVRCANKKHGEVVGDNLFEIKCDSRFCGAVPGVTVLHQFNTQTGDLVSTRRFKNPRKE